MPILTLSPDTLSSYLFNTSLSSDRLRKIGTITLISCATYYVATKIYTGYFGPLSKLPGPLKGRFYQYNTAALDKPLGTMWQKIYQCHEKYGAVVRFSNDYIAVSDKDMVKQVLVQDDLSKGLVYESLHVFGEPILITRKRDLHKRKRRIISPNFSSKHISSLEPLVHGVLDSLLANIDRSIKQNKRPDDEYVVIDCWTLSNNFAVEVVGHVAFDVSFNLFENEHHFVPDTIAQNLQLLHLLSNNPFLTMVKYLFNSKETNARSKKTAEFVRNIVLGRIRGGENARRHDVLQSIIDSQLKDADQPLDIEDIVMEMIFFLIVGSETTGSMVGFVLIELMRNMDVFHKLRSELDDIPTEGQRLFSLKQLKNQPYLNAIINETLRLYPISMNGLPRYAEKDIVLGGRLFVPKGTTVSCSIYHLHMNPEYWPNPTAFIPERWLDGSDIPANHEAYYPFSGGNCIGKQLSLMEIRFMVATLVKLYDFEPIPEELENAKDIRSFITTTMYSKCFKVRMKHRA